MDAASWIVIYSNSYVVDHAYQGFIQNTQISNKVEVARDLIGYYWVYFQIKPR